MSHEILDDKSFSFLVDADKSTPGFLKKMIDKFKENSKELLKGLQEGITSKDYKKINFSAHKLRGSAGAIGATKLMEVSAEIESDSSQKGDIEKIKKNVDELLKVYETTMATIEKRMND